VDALEQRGSDTIPVGQSAELETLRKSLSDFDLMVARSPGNLRLADL
jgi:hypothetical protein